LNAREKAFLDVVFKTHGHLPHGALEEWAMLNFRLLEAGIRGSRRIPDLAMTAWYRSAPGWMEPDAQELWGRGWALGLEVDERR